MCYDEMQKNINILIRSSNKVLHKQEQICKLFGHQNQHAHQGSPNQAKWAKSPSLDSKVKLKLPCFFLQVASFLQIICILWLSWLTKVKLHKKGFIQENLTCSTSCWDKNEKYHDKFLNLYWWNSRWKLNPKSKNN